MQTSASLLARSSLLLERLKATKSKTHHVSHFSARTAFGVRNNGRLRTHLELENLPDVMNDLDVDFTENLAAVNRYRHDGRNIRKVKEMSDKLQVNLITPLRPGKKLLVLDIDYSEFFVYRLYILSDQLW